MSFQWYDMTGLADMPPEFYLDHSLKRMAIAHAGTDLNTGSETGPCPPGEVERFARLHIPTDCLLVDIEGWRLGPVSAGYDAAQNIKSIASYKDFLRRFKSVNTHTKVGFWNFPLRNILNPWEVVHEHPGHAPVRMVEARALINQIKYGIAPHTPDFMLNEVYWNDDLPEANDALWRWNYIEAKRAYPTIPFYACYSHHSFGAFNPGLFLNILTLRWIYDHIRGWGDGAVLWEGWRYAGADTIHQYPLATTMWDSKTYPVPRVNKSANAWLRELAANGWQSNEAEAQHWIEFRKAITATAKL